MKSINEEIREDEILSDYCIVSVGNDRSINFWSTKYQQLLHRKNDAHSRFIHDCACVDEETLLTAGDETVKLWSVSSMSEIRTFKGHKDTIKCVCIMDSRSFLSGGDDNRVLLYSMKFPEAKLELAGHKNYVTDLCKMSSTKFCSCSYDGTVRKWDVQKNVEEDIYKQDGEIYCLDSNIPFRLFSIGSFGGKVIIFNKDFEKIVDLRADNAVSSNHIVSDKNYILCGDITGSLYCWDLRKSEKRFWKKNSVHKKNKGVEKIITLTEEFYASCGGDGSIVIDSFFENYYQSEDGSDSDEEIFGGHIVHPYAQFHSGGEEEEGEEEEEFVVVGSEAQVVKGRRKLDREEEEQEIKSKFGAQLRVDTRKLGRRCLSSKHDLLYQSGLMKGASPSPSPGDFVDRMKFRENGPIRSILLLPGNNVEIFLKKNSIRNIALNKVAERKKKKRQENE